MTDTLHASSSSNAIDLHVAREIRRLRIAAARTQADLAATIGVSFQQLQKYENGTNRISAGRLAWIAAALSVPIETFFKPTIDDAPAPSKSRDQESFDVDPDWQQFKAVWAALQPAVRSNLWALAKALAPVDRHHARPLD